MLAGDLDESIAQRAASTLLTQPAENFLHALERADAAPALFAYCAENFAAKPGIADAMAKNPACPVAELEKVAGGLSTAGVQALLDNLEKLTSSRSLIAALESAPGANAEQRELVAELRKGAVSEKDLEEAVSVAVPDPAKRKTLLQRLASMNVLQRVQLALAGGREERIALIRDPNKVVQRAVLQSPRLTEAEVESFAAMTTLAGEILRIISNNRLYAKNYTIVRNLTANPKTPLDISLHLLPRMTPRDLKILATSKNIPETLRSTAAKMERKRTDARRES